MPLLRPTRPASKLSKSKLLILIALCGIGVVAMVSRHHLRHRVAPLDPRTVDFLAKHLEFHDPKAARKELLDRIRGGQVVSEDITAKLKAAMSSEDRFSTQTFAYSDIQHYYQSSHESLAALFPQQTFRPNAEVLAPYTVKAHLGSPEVYVAPFVLFTPETYFDSRELRVSKLQITVEGQPVYGLRVETQMTPEMRMESRGGGRPGPLPLPYISDLNARLLGFTQGQVVLDLSENIATCEFFDYNGLLGWDKHHRYHQEDQATKPIGLTNVAHLAGDAFNISDHPDFALKVLRPLASPALFTYFLWHREPGDPNALSEGPPDFVFQLLVRS